MKALKYAIGGAAALVLAAAAALAYLAATFDPRDYHPQIVRFVHDQTGRTLHIEGTLRLSLWPDVAIQSGRAWLSERGTDERFASIGNARLTAKLLPFLSRQLVAREIRIEDGHVAVTRFADGRLNIDDLLQAESGGLQFDIGRIVVERSAFSYRDLASGKTYAIADVGIVTGRVSNRAVTPLQLEFTARDAPRTFDASTRVTARLAIDVAQQRYALTESVIRLKGRMPAIDQFEGQLRGEFAADLKERRLDATRVAATFAGLVAREAIEIKATAVNIVAAAGNARITAPDFDLRVKGPAGITQVKLAAPELTRSGDVLRADATALELVLDRGGIKAEAKIAAPLETSLAGRSITLTELKSSFKATGRGLPRGGIAGTLAGSGRIDLAKQGVHVKLAGKIDASQVKAEVTSSGFASPVYTFTLDMDQLDVGRYGGGTTKPGASSGTAFDLAALEAMPASGTVRIGLLRASGVKASNVHLVVRDSR